MKRQRSRWLGQAIILALLGIPGCGLPGTIDFGPAQSPSRLGFPVYPGGLEFMETSDTYGRRPCPVFVYRVPDATPAAVMRFYVEKMAKKGWRAHDSETLRGMTITRFGNKSHRDEVIEVNTERYRWRDAGVGFQIVPLERARAHPIPSRVGLAGRPGRRDGSPRRAAFLGSRPGPA